MPTTGESLHLDGDRCYRAVRSKDERFDGWFVGAVTSTGIYCRPSCPVRLPLRRNMRFFPTAATAQQAGFRACKRCRPDATPGSPEWDLRSDAAARAMRLIADGVVDRDGVAGLARRLGYSTRQIERLLRSEVGTGPLALARAQRARTARTLIEASDLPFAEVCGAAGFSSIRQFNDTVRAVESSTAKRGSAVAASTTTWDGAPPTASAVGVVTSVADTRVRVPSPVLATSHPDPSASTATPAGVTPVGALPSTVVAPLSTAAGTAWTRPAAASSTTDAYRTGTVDAVIAETVDGGTVVAVAVVGRSEGGEESTPTREML